MATLMMDISISIIVPRLDAGWTHDEDDKRHLKTL
eukprot:CAMPEP_0170120180 /NCGR_PEP_ID=MMETSP0020_2-20130122/14962_1 /TAXON_ID=98059 /ORGANISM="Dinobryon sp., Strain UTEXLB2267" /LENGTH=34 /DNA_ID= /DNA_START= /DNA_END= /DNA_ORIENTATION=